MARLLAKPSASYFTPTARPRFRPRVTPKIGIGGIEKPRIAPRVLPTPISGIGKNSLSGFRAPKLSSTPAASIKPAISHLTMASSTGSKPAANPAPKSPSSATGISTTPRAQTKLHNSAKAQQPGVHSIQGAKMKLNRANPIKNPLKLPSSIRI